jgi:hypothetical protein
MHSRVLTKKGDLLAFAQTRASCVRSNFVNVFDVRKLSSVDCATRHFLRALDFDQSVRRALPSAMN